MAGGKITRIVGGTNSIECETCTVYTDKFTAYVGKGSHFTADRGTIIGEPKEADAGKYFKKGWWSSDYEGNNKIKTAELDDVVYFQIDLTNNFPSKNKYLSEDQKKNISFKVFWFDGYSLLLVSNYTTTYGYPVYGGALEKIKKRGKARNWPYYLDRF